MFILSSSTIFERHFNFGIKKKSVYFSEKSQKFQLTQLSQRNQNATKIKFLPNTCALTDVTY